MRKLIATTAACLGVSLCGIPLLLNAEPIPDDLISRTSLQPKSLAAQGCMRLGVCTDYVVPITSVDVLTITLYLASDFYFLKDVRGVYYTDNNGMYMNEYHGRYADVFLNVLRHEAWHAAQDCMAGSLDNSKVAIILDPTLIPNDVKMRTQIRYQFFAPKSIPWEQEAIFASETPFMTVDALAACAEGDMWQEYKPTPKTEEWLKNNGFMK